MGLQRRIGVQEAAAAAAAARKDLYTKATAAAAKVAAAAAAAAVTGNIVGRAAAVAPAAAAQQRAFTTYDRERGFDADARRGVAAVPADGRRGVGAVYFRRPIIVCLYLGGEVRGQRAAGGAPGRLRASAPRLNVAVGPVRRVTARPAAVAART